MKPKIRLDQEQYRLLFVALEAILKMEYTELDQIFKIYYSIANEIYFEIAPKLMVAAPPVHLNLRMNLHRAETLEELIRSIQNNFSKDANIYNVCTQLIADLHKLRVDLKPVSNNVATMLPGSSMTLTLSNN